MIQLTGRLSHVFILAIAYYYNARMTVLLARELRNCTLGSHYSTHSILSGFIGYITCNVMIWLG